MPNNYPLSFTAANLLPRQTAALAALYATLNDWEAVAERAREDETILGHGKASTRRSLTRELHLRLLTLGEDELQLLAEGGAKTRRLLAWQAVCRCYPFIGNFTREVLLPKLQRFDPLILNSDYRSYYRDQALLHPKLDRIADSTRVKLESNTFKMLAEAKLIKSPTERVLQSVAPSSELCTRGLANNPHSLNFWLLSSL